MRRKRHIQNIMVMLVSLSAWSICGCGDNGETITCPAVEETEAEESGTQEANAEVEAVTETVTEEDLQEVPTEENGTMEIYAAGEAISLSSDDMVGQISVEEILKGNPILYDRFQTDGWVFEWIVSDYDNEDNYFLEDGVLLISQEGNAEDVQVIHVQGEGGAATWVSVENKFEYMDVNFDDVPDLLICTGQHGNQGLLTYYCFLQTDGSFVEAPTFTDIPNPAVDTENKLILSQWRNSAASHSWAEYKYQDNEYVMDRELREDIASYEEEQNSDEDIWVWTVNGEEIGRSDVLSESEIDDLLYNENSEWRLADDRWRTIYNNGMTADWSIYDEP